MDKVTVKICKTSDIGVNDNLFGGRMLSWLDEAGAYYAAKLAHDKNVVTVKMDEVIFTKPVKVKDYVEICASLINMGKTSITIELSAWKIDVTKEPYDVDYRDLVCSTKMVFVKIDENGKPKNI